MPNPECSAEREKLVLVTSGGGLGNRLPTILSTMRIAELTNRELFLHWNKAQTVCSLEVTDLSTSSPGNECKDVRFPGDWPDYFAHDLPLLDWSTCNTLNLPEFSESVPRHVPGSLLIRNNYRFVRFDDEPQIEYFRHPNDFGPIERMIKGQLLRHIERLQPAAHLHTTINEFARNHGIDLSCPGLHLRRKHPHCSTHDLEVFYNLVERVLCRYPRCFLAADSYEVESIFRERYGTQLVYYPKRSQSREQREAIEDAIIDMYLLAKTGHIIGSRGSTFGEMAWWLGGCRATREWTSDRPASKTRPRGVPRPKPQPEVTERHPKRMILGGGLQSGGTTIVSWCFLQRGDTDGVLDMHNDVIRTSFEAATAPNLWIKMTIGSFRLTELNELYRDLGWSTQPLLIVRDVRSAYASLKNKSYGLNGTTAEEPPLRIRFLRFLEDWKACRDRGWPILKFEDFLSDPRLELASMCYELSLEWDEAMLSWPKKIADLAYVGTPNRTFIESVNSISPKILPGAAPITALGLPQSEIEWLEETFEEYNRYHGYPIHVTPATPVSMEKNPQFLGTRRQRSREVIRRLTIMLNTDSAGSGDAAGDEVGDRVPTFEGQASQHSLDRIKDAIVELSGINGLIETLE